MASASVRHPFAQRVPSKGLKHAALGGALASAAAITVPAQATSDGGRRAELLGVGDGHALVVEQSMQVDCHDVPCPAYAVALGKKQMPRSGERLIAAANLETYLEALGAERAQLGAITPTSSLEPLSIAPEGEALKIGPDLTLSLATVARADAMAAYERTSDRPCFDPVAGPLCADCQETTRFVAGREASFWACRREPGPWRGEPLRASDCDCHAEAQIVEIRLQGRGPATGSQLFVAPHQLAQNVIGGSRSGETTDLVLVPTALAAHRTGDGVTVVAGAVAHAPEANGTYFPVVAATRPTKTADRPAGASPEPGHIEVAPVRSRPRGAACRGCALPAAPEDRWPWLGLAALGLCVLRRRRITATRSRRDHSQRFTR